MFFGACVFFFLGFFGHCFFQLPLLVFCETSYVGFVAFVRKKRRIVEGGFCASVLLNERRLSADFARGKPAFFRDFFVVFFAKMRLARNRIARHPSFVRRSLV